MCVLNTWLLHVDEPIKFDDPIITFKMFIFIIIIGLHIIWNMSWVRKHVTQPSTMWSIPCSTVMNDILLRNICACENDHNLVYTHVPLQCPFTCATIYFSQWEFHCVNNIGKVLAPYAQTPSLLKVSGYTWVNGIRANFSTLRVIMASITLFFMKPFFSFLMCACSDVQWLLLIATLTSQSYAL